MKSRACVKRTGVFIGLLALLASCGGAPSTPPNILLVSIDTLRSDRLGCYGYGRNTSPALDEFARTRAVRFERAISESSWTLPSHVSMLTGLYPLTHGATLPHLFPSDDVEFFAETLGRNGYQCFGRTDGGWMSEHWGFGRGFHSFDATDTTLAESIEDTKQFIRGSSDKGPWFAFLHTYDVHCPYDPPEPWFSMFSSKEAEALDVAGKCGNPHYNGVELNSDQVRYLSDRYDGGVRWADDALAQLFAFLEETDSWKNTIVIVTSDHGEEFKEHGQIGHERTLHRETLMIPLLVAAPGIKSAVVSTPAGLTDIVPTLLEWIGIEAHDEFDGYSQVKTLRGETDDSLPTERFSHLARQRVLFSRIDSEQHHILSVVDESLQGFDLKTDLRETTNLCSRGSCKGVAESLQAELVRQRSRRRTTRVIESLRGQ